MQRESVSEGGKLPYLKKGGGLWKLLSITVLACGISGVFTPIFAGTALFDFASDPTRDPSLIIAGNNDAPWQPIGGQADGFLALTYPLDNQYSHVIFPDIDDDRLVKAFRFEAAVRLGNSSTARPGAGFSLSFARNGDPVLDAPQARNGFAIAGAEESGTLTGISILFDTASGNSLPDSEDVEGILVRVDNTTITSVALPNRNGACDNPSAPQTGPRDPAYWNVGPGGFADPRDPGSWSTLCWQPLVIDVDEEGKLDITWKGQTILTNFQTTYFPSLGRLVLAARTATGANEHTHFDNIRITTVPADQPIVGNPVGSACGFSVRIADAGAIRAGTNLTLTLNGTNVPVSTRRDSANTFVDVDLPQRLAPGSTNLVNITFDTIGGTSTNLISVTREFVVPASAIIPPTARALSITNSGSGFLVRSHIIDSRRGPGNPNTIENAETQLGGRFTDAANVRLTNRANLTGSSGGYFTVPLINFEETASDIEFNPDHFNSEEPAGASRPNAAIPGFPLTGATNAAIEVLTFLELPAGCHTLGVNSDEGFLVTLGHTQFGTVLGSFNGGREASDKTFQIVVEEAGVYPIRLSWWEGTGPASLEFFSIVGTNRVLINDRAVTGHIKAYPVGTAAGALVDFGIERPNYGPNPESAIVATFRDAGTTLDPTSLRLFVDDVSVTPNVTVSGTNTTARYTQPGGFPLGSTHTARISYTIGTVTATNEFTFTIRVGGLFIEAEHFDFGGGQFVPEVNTIPYSGNEYEGRGAVSEVDYNRSVNDPLGDIYRIGETPNVPIAVSETPDTLDLVRGNFVVATNHVITSSINGDWYQYTRAFTNGNYFVFVAQSSPELQSGLHNRQRVRITVLSTNESGTNLTEQAIGSYQKRSTGETNTLNQLMNGPLPAVVRLGGTNVIRVYVSEGAFDWLVFVPTQNPVSVPNFVIEAEDFNFDGGQTVPAANIMPLTTSPYEGLGAAAEIDFHGLDGTPQPDEYRTNEVPNVPITASNDWNQNDRGLFIRTNNYRIISIDPGEWFNYSRTFPTGTFNIYAALSHGGSSPTNFVGGSLQLVTTNATSTNQAITELGTFHSLGGTGGFGSNELVPLTSDGGAVATVALGGNQTLRYTGTSGDFDYLVIVPSTGPISPTGPRITSITRSNAFVLITWIGGGTLEASRTFGPAAVWTPITPSGPGTALIPISEGYIFFRVRLTGTEPIGPRITSISRANNTITITWTGGGTLQASPALGTAAVWTPVTGAGAGTATVPNDQQHRFFRVAVP